ncbi:MAG: response regulator [Planctomycetota bacterium]|nr:response regulator [Planctomycetota bacterium]
MDILFIEDEENARSGLTAMLTAMGHTVDSAESTDEAVAKMQTKAYGLLLLDVMLPAVAVLADIERRKRGQELLLRHRSGSLGELKTCRDVPVVAITAVTDTTVVRELNGYAKAVLHKPIDPDEAIEIIKPFLGGKQP